jgi:hypothetical protein
MPSPPVLPRVSHMWRADTRAITRLLVLLTCQSCLKLQAPIPRRQNPMFLPSLSTYCKTLNCRAVGFLTYAMVPKCRVCVPNSVSTVKWVLRVQGLHPAFGKTSSGLCKSHPLKREACSKEPQRKAPWFTYSQLRSSPAWVCGRIARRETAEPRFPGPTCSGLGDRKRHVKQTPSAVLTTSGEMKS